MRAGILRLAVLTALLSVRAGAQTVLLTESEALARAAEHPRIEAARAAAQVVAADGLAARRWPNPRASVTREAVAGIAEHMVTVTQALPITGRRQLDGLAADARTQAAASRADEQVRRMRADVRLAFADLVLAQARERELTDIRVRLQALADVIARREAAGDAAGFDRLRAEREVLEVDAERASATVDRARAQAALWNLVLVTGPAASLVAVPAAPPPSVVPETGALVVRAYASRPLLGALRLDVQAAEAAGRAASRRVVPEPEVVAGTKLSSAGTGDVGAVFGVHITVPLFDRAEPERAAADARARQARAEIEATRRALQADIEARREAVVQRRDIASRYRQALIGGAGEIERIAQVSYDAGERGILELLDAHRTASTARLRQVQLDAAVRVAEIELEYISGWELP